MANVHAHAMASFGSPVGNGGFFRNIGATISARRNQMSERARIRRELETCTDRQLGDLGLSRFDIEDVVNGRYGR